MIIISRKARGTRKGDTMLNIHRIPDKMNGYTIVAVLPKILPDGLPSSKEVVILGHDATRKHSKYVTAYVTIPSVPSAIKEWFWGNYMEALDVGLKSLVDRASINLDISLFGGETVNR